MTDETKIASTRRHTVVVLGLALVLRVFAAWFSLAHNAHGWFFVHGTEMGYMAQSIVEGRGLGSPFGGETGPTAMFAPVYPLLVAAIFRWFGMYSTASALASIAIHLAANLATIWLTMHLARRCFDERTALIAGLMWALAPPLWWLPTIFWDTSITIALSMGTIVLALRVQRRPTAAVWLGFGAYCGLVTLFNPALLFVLVGIAAVVVCVLWRRKTFVAAHALLAAFVFVLVFSPWPVRNARVFHTFVPLRTAVGEDVWMGNHPGASGYLDEKLFPTFNPAEMQAYNREGEIAYTNGKMALAKSWILQHPGAFAMLTLRRVIRFWTGSGTQHGPALFWIYATLTTLLGAYGLQLLYRSDRELAWLLAVPLLVFPLPYYVSHAEFRFRVVVDPILAVLAAYALGSGLLARSVRPSEPTDSVAG